jgi:hypothetical protein
MSVLVFDDAGMCWVPAAVNETAIFPTAAETDGGRDEG